MQVAHLEADAALAVRVAELLGQPHGLAERLRRLRQVAGLQAGAADRLPGEGLAVLVPGRQEHGQAGPVGLSAERVTADQVGQAVARLAHRVGAGRLQQVHIHQQVGDVVGAVPVERGADHPARLGGPAEQAEGAGRLVRQVAVAAVEAGPYLLQLAEPVVGEPLPEHRQRPAGPARQARAGAPERQPQPPAGGHDGQGVLTLAGHPVGARDPAEQQQRLLGRQLAEVDLQGAGQLGDPAPAGDDHRAVVARQQWPYLGGVQCLVEQHQHRPLGEQRAQQGRALVHRGRRTFDAERAKHFDQQLGRFLAVEVEVELSGGERPRRACAAWTARVDLPAPGAPEITAIVNDRASAASSSLLPVKSGTSGGSWCGTGGGASSARIVS